MKSLLVSLPLALFAVLGCQAAETRSIPMEEIVSPKGIKAWLSSDPRAEDVAIVARFRGGSFADSVPGTTSVAVTMMARGVAGEGTAEFWIKSPKIGAVLSIATAAMTVNVTITVPKKSLPEASALAARLVQLPAMAIDDPVRLQNALMRNLEVSAADPAYQANLALAELTGPDHPSFKSLIKRGGKPPILNHDALMAWHRAHFARDNLIVGIVGALSKAEAGMAVDRIFADLPAKSDVPSVPPHPNLGSGKVVTMPFDSLQTTIAMRSAWPIFDGASTSEQLAAQLLRVILVGVRDNRLEPRLEKALGAPYGVSMTAVSDDALGFERISATVPNDKAKVALKTMREGLEELISAGTATAELQGAKAYFREHWGRGVDAPQAVANVLADEQMNHRPLGQYNRIPDLADAITPAQIDEVARKYLKPEMLATVLVGKPGEIDGARQIAAY